MSDAGPACPNSIHVVVGEVVAMSENGRLTKQSESVQNVRIGATESFEHVSMGPIGLRTVRLHDLSGASRQLAELS